MSDGEAILLGVFAPFLIAFGSIFLFLFWDGQTMNILLYPQLLSTFLFFFFLVLVSFPFITIITLLGNPSQSSSIFFKGVSRKQREREKKVSLSLYVMLRRGKKEHERRWEGHQRGDVRKGTGKELHVI